jgi:RNA polymerase sigma-70 factor (ECF subfamily)
VYDSAGLALFPRYTFDAAYVQRLVASDPETERHFHDYFGELLTAKLRRRLRSAALVEDVKQETFLRALTKLRKQQGLDVPGSLGAFVNSMCDYILLETYRSEEKRRHEPIDEERDAPAAVPTAESTLVDASDRLKVRQALERLPPKDRTLLRWLFFEERPKDAICQALGCNRGHLRVLLHRAKARFRTAYHQDEPPAGLKRQVR